MDKPIDILVTSYFRKDFTQKTLEHIIARTKTSFKLIVVDNGSTDGTREMLSRMQLAYPNLFKRVILNNKNEGLEKAKMQGLEYVESEYFVNTDNDILCPDYGFGHPDWLAEMKFLIEFHSEFAAIAMRPQILVGVGPIFAGAKDVVANNVAGGSLRIMSLAKVKEVGGWREDGFENRNEEWHICNKLRAKGYKVGYARDLFCYHLFGPGENWGYPTEVPHYHNPGSKHFARDTEYDPLTMVPKIKSNE